MFGLGMQELLVVAVIVAALGAFRFQSKNRVSGPTLVLRTLRVTEVPSDGVFVDIVGRPSGLFGWLFTALGLEAETDVKVTDTEIIYRRSSVFGEMHHVLPFPSASSTYCQYVRPLWLLVLAALALVFALYVGLWQRDSWALLGGLCLVAVLGVVYWFGKKIVLSVRGYAHENVGITFKQGVIEHIPVDIDKARHVAELIHKRILEAQVHDKFVTAVESRRPAFVKPERLGFSTSKDSYSKFCTSCGAGVVGQQRFCPTCGKALD